MSLITTKVNDFIAQYDELEALLVENQNEMSQIDSDLSKLYHKIEGAEIKHVSESHALIKELKVILNKRREIKLNFILLITVSNFLKTPMAKFKQAKNDKLDKHNKVIEKLNNNI